MGGRATEDRAAGKSRGLVPDASSGRRGPERPRRRRLAPLMVKIAALGALNALAIWSLPPIIEQRWWGGLAVVVVATLLVDYAYLSRRAIPLKYLVPGTIFAIAFQVVPVLYSGYIAFTNFSTSHRLTQEQAVGQITARTSNLPGSTRYQMTILGADGGAGELALLLSDEDRATFLGTAEGLTPVDQSEIVHSFPTRRSSDLDRKSVV